MLINFIYFIVSDSIYGMLRVMKLFRNEEEAIISCSCVAYHNFYMMKMIHLWCSVGSTAGVCHCNINGHNGSCLSIRHLFSFIFQNDGEFYSF